MQCNIESTKSSQLHRNIIKAIAELVQHHRYDTMIVILLVLIFSFFCLPLSPNFFFSLSFYVHEKINTLNNKIETMISQKKKREENNNQYNKIYFNNYKI